MHKERIMFYNTKVKIGEETYRWGEVVNRRIAYKNNRWHKSVFMLENTEKEERRIQRLYNFVEGAFDFAEYNGWRSRYAEPIITRYYQEYWEGKEE